MPGAPSSRGAGTLARVARFALGDAAAKVVSFLAFVYLARTLGVERFGAVELALAIVAYLLYLADAGLEAWATREASRSWGAPEGAPEGATRLVARVVPLRLLLSAAVLLLVPLGLELLPEVAGLGTLVSLFALTLPVQALSLRWLALGGERMRLAGASQLVAQAVFALGVVAAVRGPGGWVWVPVARLAGEASAALLLAVRLRPLVGRPRWSLAGAGGLLAPAAALGLSRGLGLLSYNFDALLLGYLLGAGPVGLYAAAYRPVTAGMALPLTWFLGLFPALSRTWAEGPGRFAATVGGSLHLAALFALPLGVGGSLLAAPIVELLFGPGYAAAAPVLAVLAWSGVSVVLRGTWRMALQAASRLDLDLAVAGLAVTVNVVLNLLWIPAHGPVGAAWATLVSEGVWLVLLGVAFRAVQPGVGLGRHLWRPVAAGGAMAGAIRAAAPFGLLPAAGAGVAAYAAVLALLGEAAAFGRATAAAGGGGRAA